MRAPESRRCPVCDDDHLHFFSHYPFGIRKGWVCTNCAIRYLRHLAPPGIDLTTSERRLLILCAETLLGARRPASDPGRLLSVPGTEIVLSEVVNATDNSRPPTAACFLLDLLLRKADRKAIPGDLEEEFRANREIRPDRRTPLVLGRNGADTRDPESRLSLDLSRRTNASSRMDLPADRQLTSFFGLDVSGRS